MQSLLVVKNGCILILIKFGEFAVDRAASEFGLPTSGPGSFRTCVAGLSMSVAGGKAEVAKLGHDFRF